MALGFVADMVNMETAEEIACAIEYVWNSDKDNDRFVQYFESNVRLRFCMNYITYKQKEGKDYRKLNCTI